MGRKDDDVPPWEEIEYGDFDTLNRRAAIDRRIWIVQNGPCQRCGSDQRLTIDHILPPLKDPALRRGGGSHGTQRIFMWNPTRRAMELENCQVLCQTCHNSKTFLESQGNRGELTRQQHEWYARQRRMYGKIRMDRWEYLLAREVVLQPEIEAEFAKLRAKYGAQQEVDDEPSGIVATHYDGDASPSPLEKPDDWPDGLIVWPF